MVDSTETEMSSSSLGRRAALKAGVGAGVGLIAWSGPTITSLGGTPAYAIGCTFVVNIDLSEGCRNTTQANPDPYSYQPINLQPNVDGYVVASTLGNNDSCASGAVATVTPPSGIECQAVISFATNNNNCNNGNFAVGQYTFAPNPDGSVTIPLDCYAGVGANTFYTIEVNCNTIGAPVECLA